MQRSTNLASLREKKGNLMETKLLNELMRLANSEQKELLMHIIYHIQPLSGKTFVIKHI